MKTLRFMSNILVIGLVAGIVHLVIGLNTQSSGQVDPRAGVCDPGPDAADTGGSE